MAPFPPAPVWLDRNHSIPFIISPKVPQRPDLPLKPTDWERLGNTRSWRASVRAGSLGQRLLLFNCLVLIFGVRWISLQDSDPQRGHGSVQDRRHRLHWQLLQDEHLAPAQQGSIHLEGRVLCGGSDHNNRPAFQVRKKGVLNIPTHTEGERRRL